MVSTSMGLMWAVCLLIGCFAPRGLALTMCRLDLTRLQPGRGWIDRQMDGWMEGGWVGELGSEGGEGGLIGRGETRTVEQHKLTMTYSIGASVTAALLDVVLQSLLSTWYLRAARGRAAM